MCLEHAEEEVVGDHQHALVGEEDLEGADALLDHRLHVGERALVGLRDRHVEAVVHVRGAARRGPATPPARSAARRGAAGSRSRRCRWCRPPRRRACPCRSRRSSACRRTASPCACGCRSARAARSSRWRRSARRPRRRASRRRRSPRRRSARRPATSCVAVTTVPPWMSFLMLHLQSRLRSAG